MGFNSRFKGLIQTNFSLVRCEEGGSKLLRDVLLIWQNTRCQAADNRKRYCLWLPNFPRASLLCGVNFTSSIKQRYSSAKI